MSRIIDTCSIKKTIKTDFSRIGDERSTEGEGKFYYDSFAFRDRITNKKFQYKQARKTQGKLINYLDWKNGLSTSKEMKESLKQYRFTKSFQIDCIRKKYLKQSFLQNQDTGSIKKQFQGESKDDLPRALTKNTLFQINKQQMRRILENNDSVSPEILELNQAKKYRYTQKHNPMKKGSKKWKFIDHSIKQSDQSFSYSADIENKVAEKAMNHMKNQIKSNCQYLLNMPIQMKKKALFTQQLRKHKKYYKPILTNFNHSQLQKCLFSSPKDEKHYYSVEEQETRQRIDHLSNIMLNVKHGFMNQVQLELQNNPDCHFLKDKAGNNIFHIAAKEGNLEMIKLFLNTLSPRNCLKLLKQKNNLKRSPYDKASFLGYQEILSLIQEYKKQNKYTS